jgi:hypothetical protein
MKNKVVSIMNPGVHSRVSFKKDFYSWLGMFLLLGMGFVGLFILPFSITSDGQVRFQFMDTLVHHLQITPMRYSMIGPIFSLPLWVLASFFKDPDAVIARYNLLLYASAIFVLFMWLKSHFERKFIITFIFILSFGSMFPGHLINYYGEVFSAVFLAMGTVGLVTKKERIGWICLLLAVLNTPALLVPFALVVLYLAWESRRFRYLALIPICLFLIILESRLRMGSFLAVFQTYLNTDHGYTTVLPYSGRVGYSYPFLLGILSIFLSFGKGLIFYCPGLTLIGWAWKSIVNPVERKLLILWLLITLGLLLAYASWWAWYGGWYWGPRFFLFASLPAAWFLAKLVHSNNPSLLKTLTLAILITLSLWVGVNGVVFQQKTLDLCKQNNFALESLCWYVPEFSPLIRPLIVHGALSHYDKLILFLYGVLWLYILVPTGINLFRQLKVVWEDNRSLFNFPSWRF